MFKNIAWKTQPNLQATPCTSEQLAAFSVLVNLTLPAQLVLLTQFSTLSSHLILKAMMRKRLRNGLLTGLSSDV